MKAYIGTLCLCLVASAAASANPTALQPDGVVVINAIADRATAHVAEPVRLNLIVTAPTGTAVILPRVADRLGEFQVRDMQTKPDVPTSDGAQRTWISIYTLDTLQSGELEIPAISVQYRTAGATEFQTISSDPVPIRVISLL